MKKRILKKWLKALRSGEYEQGQGQLRDAQNNFCCLGVLCNIHAQEHPKIAKQESDGRQYLTHSALLPLQVATWAGLTKNTRTGDCSDGSTDIAVRYRRKEMTLVHLNDTLDLSFKQIANVLEHNFG
jgi:hypothetical protein